MIETKTAKTGPLVGLKVVELAGIGPAPLCATLLADMGADILRIDRNQLSGLGTPRPGKYDLTRRSRPSVSVDLKSQEGITTVMRLVAQAAVVIDPFRPGVTEKLGLGPDDCFAHNKQLIYARMTGWGQDGPLAQAAGHDINYLALTGVLNAIGPKEKPVPPLNVVADMGGGAMFLAFGILAAVYEAQRSQKGQVVDVSMTEGAAFLATGNFGLTAAGLWSNEREDNFLDGGAHYYGTYQTKDELFIALGAIEAKFYQLLLEKLGLNQADLPEQMDRTQWPQMRQKFANLFKTKTRDEWCEVFEGSDVCFAPVLSFEEAAEHPHNRARGSFVEVEEVVQPSPAPKFSRTPSAQPTGAPNFGENTEEGLKSWGFSSEEIGDLLAKKAIGWQG